MKILFDIVHDNIAGWEWRQLLIQVGQPPRILSKSWCRFRNREEIFEQLTTMSKALGIELEIIDGKYTPPKPDKDYEPINHIAQPRELAGRKDIDG